MLKKIEFIWKIIITIFLLIFVPLNRIFCKRWNTYRTLKNQLPIEREELIFNKTLLLRFSLYSYNAF
jgi:hypothetical protein